MCGISGVLIPRVADRLHHRGPDGRGGTSSLLPWAHASIEMTRLSIVDQSAIPVPFDFSKSCGVVLAFNGEVFNWRALRAELSDGSPWETSCDAEVVARAWRRWGPGCLDHFNGMFALALVDTERGEVFLARDRAGEKPLYYALSENAFTFASEAKALSIKLAEGPCPDAEVFEFDCVEETPFVGVRHLPPGTYLHFKSAADAAAPRPSTWWSLPSAVDESMTWKSAVEETLALVVDSIRLRAVSEVKVAVMLSGGLDSAIIQAVAPHDALYTVTFPRDGVDNLTLARLASGGRELRAITFGLPDLERELPNIAYHLDTPATWTAVCQWHMARAMAEDGVVVALSGEGADELWGGYSRYRLLYWSDRMRSDEHLAAYEPLRRHLFGAQEGELLARMIDRSPGESMHEHAQVIVERFTSVLGEGADLVTRMSRVDFYTTMQVLLRMADRMMAAYSIENRSPFLDYRLMELAARTPTRWKINENGSKVVLREVARRLGVAPEILDEKTKRGLFLPWAKWTAATGGARGAWDRRGFADAMRAAWRSAFFSTGAR